MKANEPRTIVGSGLSEVWARAFLHVVDGGDSDCLIVAIRDFSGDLPSVDPRIADALDATLRTAEIPTIRQTALTLVPYDRWIRTGKPDVAELSQWYLQKLLPRLKARCAQNRRGTYFERLISYSGTRINDGEAGMVSVNQLAFVVSLWKRGVEQGHRPRQSALQLSCFDPAKDHTGAPRAGFPCLQQISLTYSGPGTLEVNAFYPTEYLFDRAYGNYLGLCQLGHLLAHEMGVRFSAFTCFIARPQIGSKCKGALADLIQVIKTRIPANESVREPRTL